MATRKTEHQWVGLGSLMTNRDYWCRGLLAFQGVYYCATGLWPLVHLSSFEAVTGPKTDGWLVQRTLQRHPSAEGAG